MFDIRRFAIRQALVIADSGHHHCHKGWVQLNCFFCAAGVSGLHLGFNLNQGYFNCWRCGGHSVWKVVSHVLGTDRKDLIQKEINACQSDSIHNPVRKQVTRKRKIKRPPGMEKLTKAHRKYLKGRGFDPLKLGKVWSLAATRHLSGQWNWRVIFPILNQHSEEVAYGGRAIHKDTKPKYKISDDEDCLEDPKSFLYGIHKVKDNSIMIVEGPTDVWNLGIGSVGTLGIDWTVEQGNILRQFDRRFILFDPEPLAQKQAVQLAGWLSFYPGETEVVDGLKGDPGSLSHSRVKRLRRFLGFS